MEFLKIEMERIGQMRLSRNCSHWLNNTIFVFLHFPSRVSDKEITQRQRSGFLDKIKYGDWVMADWGFNMSDDLALCGAKLVMPTFY